MKDEKKTKAQLIAELVDLRRYVEGMKNTEIQRKRVQRALCQSEETAQAILKATTDSLALLDRDGNILVLNEVTAKRHGKRAGELVGMCVYDILPPDLAASRKAQCEDVVRSGKAVRFEDERDGRAFDNSLYPVFDAEGEVSAIAVYARDITEQKRVEGALRRSEEEFRGLFEHSPMGIYRTTPGGKILMVNTALVHMLGYTFSEELTRRNLEDEGYHPEYPRSEFKRRIDREGKILALESAWKRKDGRYVYVRESARAVFHNNGRPSFYEGMVEDITERKRVEEELRENQIKLAEQNLLLEEKNIALRQVMERLSVEKEHMIKQVRANVDQVLLPLLERLKGKGSQLDQMYIDLVENNVKKLTSSYGSEVSAMIPRLTQREIEISNMIMNGLTSKEIARLLNISYRSVETHRNNIRKKLKITNKGVNLTTYLKALHRTPAHLNV